MNAFRLAACMFLLTACNPTADPSTSGSLSDRLGLAVSYQSTESQFTVILSNRTSNPLRLQVDSRQFHGRVIVTPPSGQAIEYLDSAFTPLALTGIWEVPIQTLHPRGSVTWVLPVSKLENIHGKLLSTSELQGATVHAKLEELAIVPRSGSHISDNAKQVSAPITIPNLPPQSAGRGSSL